LATGDHAGLISRTLLLITHGGKEHWGTWNWEK
jgi:hypothetical protein